MELFYLWIFSWTQTHLNICRIFVLVCVDSFPAVYVFMFAFSSGHMCMFFVSAFISNQAGRWYHRCHFDSDSRSGGFVQRQDCLVWTKRASFPFILVYISLNALQKKGDFSPPNILEWCQRLPVWERRCMPALIHAASTHRDGYRHTRARVRAHTLTELWKRSNSFYIFSHKLLRAAC